MFGLPKRSVRESGPASTASRAALRAAPHVKASLHEGGVVWIDVDRGQVFSSNRVGAMIWNGVVEHGSLDRVADSISREFAISAEAARADADEYLTRLVAEGLLVTGAN